jgi:hypothetical protein
MKNKIFLTTALSAIAFSGLANAQATGGGTMGVTANIVGSLNVTITTDGSGFLVTGSGSSAGSLALGNVQMYGGTVPTNVTRTTTSTTSFTLATPFDIRVDLANDVSSTFGMTANLASADTNGNVYTLGGTTLTTSPLSFATLASYATATSYPFTVTILAANNSGSLTNSIVLTANAN